ncbi:MAG: phosphatidylserine/phosphatidylglycerophosphate/cardiolipin synthase family protein [Patescibacteria group bacterium]
MRYKFYTTSEKTWEGMLEALKLSQKSIYWESYILLDTDGDELNQKIFDTLKEKAEAGLSVKIIADYWGSFFLSSKTRKALEDAGAEILFFKGHGLLGRNHKKLLIIDEKIAFIGGVNLAKHHRHWLDLHIRLEGRIVNYLLRSFVKTYYFSGGRDRISVKKSIIGKLKIKVIEHWPGRKKYVLKKHYQKVLSEAKNNITIITPYFVPYPWLVKSLYKAVERGAIIDILLPKKTDVFVMNLANHFFASLVYRPGINFYFVKKMIHAKALLIDKTEALVGSQNIDALSFNNMMEGGVVFQKQNMINKLISIIESWKKEGEKLDFQLKNSWWRQKILWFFLINF